MNESKKKSTFSEGFFFKQWKINFWEWKFDFLQYLFKFEFILFNCSYFFVIFVHMNIQNFRYIDWASICMKIVTIEGA